MKFPTIFSFPPFITTGLKLNIAWNYLYNIFSTLSFLLHNDKPWHWPWPTVKHTIKKPTFPYCTLGWVWLALGLGRYNFKV